MLTFLSAEQEFSCQIAFNNDFNEIMFERGFVFCKYMP